VPLGLAIVSNFLVTTFAAVVFCVGERSGQARPYVRPVTRLEPLAIMGVRLRVRHQSKPRAQGAKSCAVSPELYYDQQSFPSRY
jgi:hypothetical protein